MRKKNFILYTLLILLALLIASCGGDVSEEIQEAVEEVAPTLEAAATEVAPTIEAAATEVSEAMEEEEMAARQLYLRPAWGLIWS